MALVRRRQRPTAAEGLAPRLPLGFLERRDHLCLGVVPGPWLTDICPGARRRRSSAG